LPACSTRCGAHPNVWHSPRDGSGANDTPPTPGDFTGVVHPQYAPNLDGDPDPGEIVWTWVPYEEDPGRGKDRPVLVVGHDGRWLLGLMLSTVDHDALPHRVGETWIDLGSGDWDEARRASEVRADRVIRLDPMAVRREGAVLDRARFELVTGSLAAARDW
jgi:hypothetical protein